MVAAAGAVQGADDGALRAALNLAAVPALAQTVGDAIEKSRRSGHDVAVVGKGCHRHAMALTAAGTYLGAFVLTSGEALEPVDVRTLEHAGHIAALLILAQDAIINAEDRVRGELLSELLSARRPYPGELLLRARSRGLDAAGLGVIVAITGTGDRLVEVTRRLHDVVSRWGGVGGEHDGMPVALLPAGDAAKAAAQIHRHVGKALGLPLLVCGTEVRVGSVEPIGSSFVMITRCCALLRELGVVDGHVTTSEFAMYAVLFDPARGDDLTAFLESALGPLLARDASRGTDLVPTLSAYFAHSTNMARTARALHVHTNTLTKRLERIASILGDDWQNPDSALTLHLAIRLHDLADRIRARHL